MVKIKKINYGVLLTIMGITLVLFLVSACSSGEAIKSKAKAATETITETIELKAGEKTTIEGVTIVAENDVDLSFAADDVRIQFRTCHCIKRQGNDWFVGADCDCRSNDLLCQNAGFTRCSSGIFIENT